MKIFYGVVVLRSKGKYVMTAWQDCKEARTCEAAGSPYSPGLTSLSIAKKALKKAKKRWPDDKYSLAKVELLEE